MTERVDLGTAGPVPGPIETTTIMRRDHLSQPFDLEADDAADETKEFWGSSRGWISREHPTVDDGTFADDSSGDLWGEDTTGSLAAIRDGVRAFRPQRIDRHDPSGQVQRTRQHGLLSRRQAPAAPAGRDASLGELASSWLDDDVPADDFEQAGPETELIPLSPVHPLAERIGLGAVDPLLVRVGMVVLIVVLLVPLALILRPSNDEVIGAGAPDATAVLIATDDPSDASTSSPSDQPASAPSVSDASASTASAPVVTSQSAVDAEPADAASPERSAGALPTSQSSAEIDDVGALPTSQSSAENDDVGDVAQSSATSNADAASVSAAAERVVPACPTTYVAGPGDSWYRIADAAGVAPSALLDENRATVHTVILPGADICLPAGATMPTQPTTTTAAPVTTQAPTTAPVTTQPATTQPPVTSPPASANDVQQIIRDVWPDELEEKALQIAWRESNYKPNAFNGWCCYGVFQIYWSVHADWLDDYGIYSSSDLFDANKNIRAAYALYQSSGGWGPWGG